MPAPVRPFPSQPIKRIDGSDASGVAYPRGMRRPRLVAALTSATVAAALATSSRAHAADTKVALAMMHFNIQYVAGGMVGFWPNPDPVLDQTQEANEDQIITESFEPVLDLFLAHPKW